MGPRLLGTFFYTADDIDIDSTAVVDELVHNRTKNKFLPAGTQGFADNDPGNIVFAGIIDSAALPH
jgi:hypothetical protein